ncbi:MAG: ribosome maturation factor RimM [Gallionellaceae bacterium]|nr:MAG: ribosome maturation factor RimM [Gallionellaceae bacterium]
MVVMGRIVGAQGILGWVKVQTFTEYLDGLLDYDDWYIGNDKQPWRKIQVLDANVHGKVLVAKLDGIVDRTAAEKCKGLLVAVHRDSFPGQEEGEYYWSDLIGMKVVNLADEELGAVDTLLETGANDVLSVRDVGGKEILIPFIASVIQQVRLDDKVIRVDWQADYLK